MKNHKMKIVFPLENLLALVREAISVRKRAVAGTEAEPVAEERGRLERLLTQADRAVRGKIAFLLDPAYPFADEEEGRLIYRIVPASRMHGALAGMIEQALVESVVCAWFAEAGRNVGNPDRLLEELKGLALKNDGPMKRKAVK